MPETTEHIFGTGVTARYEWDPETGETVTRLSVGDGEISLTLAQIDKIAKRHAATMVYEAERHSNLSRFQANSPDRFGLVSDYSLNPMSSRGGTEVRFLLPGYSVSDFGAPFMVWFEEKSEWRVALNRLEGCGVRMKAAWNNPAEVEAAVDYMRGGEALLVEAALVNQPLYASQKAAYDREVAIDTALTSLKSLGVKTSLAAVKRAMQANRLGRTGERGKRMCLGSLQPGYNSRGVAIVVGYPIYSQDSIPETRVHPVMEALGYTKVASVPASGYWPGNPLQENEIWTLATEEQCAPLLSGLRFAAENLTRNSNWGDMV